MAYVTNAEVQAWVIHGGTALTSVDTSLLDSCIAAAAQYIADDSGRIWEKAAYTRNLDGNAVIGKYGEILRLPSNLFPVSATDPFTLTENGIALVVAQGYSTTADAILVNAGLEEPGKLVRQTSQTRFVRPGSPWAPGVQNITTTFSAGPTTTPEDIKLVAKELSWLFYQDGSFVGVVSYSKGGAASTISLKLSDVARGILDRRRVWR
jgi:hypothetical protein